MGCADAARSRELAVTVTDAPELDCVGITNSDAFEQTTMDSIAKDIEKAWLDARAFDPPAPTGRAVMVNETERAMSAWFLPHPASDPFRDPPHFDSPTIVYAGEPHDGYIEGEFRDVFNTDELDMEAGREPCGDRYLVSGTLSVTDAKGILGRIRWLDIVFVESVTSACAGRIECVRDIAIEGLELE